MQRSELEAQCREVLAAQLGLTDEFLEHEFTPGMDMSDLVDQIDAVELVMALEETFDCDIDENALAYNPSSPWSLDRIVGVVDAALNAKGAAA